MSGTPATAATARAARTRTKHDRWIAELAEAGWSVTQASHISIEAAGCTNDTTDLNVFCLRCQEPLLKCNDAYGVTVALPRVLHAVSGHTCEERS